MKLQVTIHVPSKVEIAPTAFDLVVFGADTVDSVKERIATAQDVPFTECDLVLGGKVLDNGWKMCDAGVKDGCSLDFVVRASEACFAQQLSDLLKARPVSVAELGMLYAHRFGASPVRALQILGVSKSLAEFLEGSKTFHTDARGLVSACSPSQKVTLRVLVRPPSVTSKRSWADENKDQSSSSIVQIVADVGDTLSKVTSQVALAAQVSSAFPVHKLYINGNDYQMDNHSTLTSCKIADSEASIEFVATASEASLTRQLLDLFGETDELCIDELSLLYTTTHGVNADHVAMNLVDTSPNCLLGFIRKQSSTFGIRGNTLVVRLRGNVNAVHGSLDEKSEHKRLLGLAVETSGRTFQVEVTQMLCAIVTCLIESTFLTIHHVVIGGAAGVGTALKASSDSQITLFVNSLSPTERETWLPGLLQALTIGLQQNLSPHQLPSLSVHGPEDDAIILRVEGLTSVKVFVSPVFATHTQALEVLKAQPETLRPIYAPSLAEQEVRFIKKQPESVKITARLLKLWRDKQAWSSSSSRPSDKFVDLLSVHICGQLPKGKFYDQSEALAMARALLVDINNLRVVWPMPFYGSVRVPAALLEQRPLLMDPVNPFSNVVDPKDFNTEELIRAAEASSAFLL